jgi:DNA-binding beta-propeller fold protein YncE
MFKYTDVAAKAALGTVRLVGITLLLTSCGGGGGGGGGGNGTPAPILYTVGGTVSNLVSGTQLILKDNGADALTIGANGPFTFATSLAASSTYTVTVSAQPSEQTCTVANASGTATNNVTSVTVTCASAPQYAYVVNSSNDNTLSQYSIGADGTLTPLDPATIPTGQFPQNVTIDPVGGYVYVANYIDNSISQFVIGSTGALSSYMPGLIQEQPNSAPWAVAIAPSGNAAYILNSSNNSISENGQTDFWRR